MFSFFVWDREKSKIRKFLVHIKKYFDYHVKYEKNILDIDLYLLMQTLICVISLPAPRTHNVGIETNNITGTSLLTRP